MSVESPSCNQSRITRFLQGKMSPAEVDDFESHLTSCSSCRVNLEDTAADPAAWQNASRYLRDELIDMEPLSTLLSHQEDRELATQVADDGVRRVIDLLAPTDDPQMLGRVGSYEVAGVIGTGGNGIVLKGHDPALNRFVAIKVLAPHLASSGAARQRFAREAQAAAAVVHENVIAIHGVDEFAGLPYLVMPYERGSSLQRRIDGQGPLRFIEVLRIGMQTAAGLAAAHAQGLVHRDIKPANILLADGVARVTITDFGLARATDDASMTRSGMITGTPQFMSPEQARGDNVDHRSDLFSLGSVLYAMCTGHPPFRAETSYGMLRRICESQPRPIRESNPAAPEWLCRLIDKLHAKRPEDRFQTAAEVAELLNQCLAHLQQPATQSLPDVLREEVVARVSMARHTGLLVMATVALLLIVATVWAWPRARLDDALPSAGSRSGDAVQAATVVSPSGDDSAAAFEFEGTWEDDIAAEIAEVEAEVDQLEVRTSRLLGEGGTTDLSP